MLLYVSISNLIEEIAQHFGLNEWDWITFIISVLAFLVAIYAAFYQYKSYASQKETEHNTNKMTDTQQIELLYAMVRHLYRDMVTTGAMVTKLKRDPSKMPSIEHLEKLHVETSDVDPEAFVNSGKKLAKLKELQLKMRNYNIEIDTAARYFLTPGIKQEAKEHILHELMFKPGYLTSTICDILTEQFGETDALDKAYYVVYESHKKNLEENKDAALHDTLTANELISVEQVKKYCGEEGVFKEHANEFLSHLNQDICIECGRNANGDDKIFFI